MDAAINVVLSTDEGYLRQSFIVMESVMLNAESIDFYNFYILTNQEVIDDYQEYITYFQNKYCNCNVKYVMAEEMLGEVAINMKHITKPTYYRLLLPYILRVDKCIYLDSDIVVVDNLRKLYEIDINDYMIGGVKAPTYHLLEEKEDYKDKSGLVNMDQYINAGVLLMNLKEMRRSDFVKSALEMVNKPLPGQDQDIVNRLCYGRIKHLPFKYNFQPVRLPLKGLGKVFAEQELEAARNFPVIIHYLTPEKPWEYLDILYADRWWEVCSKTMFLEYFYQKYRKEFIYYGVIKHKTLWKQQLLSDEWLKELENYEDIYIYGAGKIGRILTIKLLNRNIKIKGILVSKMTNKEPDYIEEIPVMEFPNFVSDSALIIIATNKIYHAEIRRKLFDENKLFVMQYIENEI